MGFWKNLFGFKQDDACVHLHDKPEQKPVPILSAASARDKKKRKSSVKAKPAPEETKQ